MQPTDEAVQAVFGTEQPQISAQAPGAQPELGQAMDALKRLLNGPPTTAIRP
jgi:hypothetical protein